MAGDDRNDDTPAAPKGRRRRKPPVIELEAKEIPGAPAAERGKGRAAAPGAGAEAARPEEASFEWRTLLSLAPVATAAAALVGAVAAILVVLLFDRGSDPRIGKLANEVAGLAQRVETASRPDVDAAAVAALSQKIDRLVAGMADLEKRAAALATRPTPALPDLAPLGARIAKMEAEIGQLRSTVAARPAAATPASVEALEKRIGALEQRVTTLGAAARADTAPSLAAEVVVLGALREAVSAGRPFVAELAAAQAVLGERASRLQPLEKAASTGFPTTAELTRRFADLASAIVREPEADGGFLSRLLTSAARLVEVRPVGEARGESTGAMVARIESRLRHNDLSGALAEAERLPPAARAVAAAWLAGARERRDADNLAHGLMTEALAALARERRR
jgi:hypothetical protein